mmetsp:Transcript_6343/g.18591  ORF Transcript_6343/g.18591 Transcript_6343/m.18591 type:complete len:236 (+) Transcript_6343:362-1069(+)
MRWRSPPWDRIWGWEWTCHCRPSTSWTSSEGARLPAGQHSPVPPLRPPSPAAPPSPPAAAATAAFGPEPPAAAASTSAAAPSAATGPFGRRQLLLPLQPAGPGPGAAAADGARTQQLPRFQAGLPLPPQLLRRRQAEWPTRTRSVAAAGTWPQLQRQQLLVVVAAAAVLLVVAAEVVPWKLHSPHWQQPLQQAFEPLRFRQAFFFRKQLEMAPGRNLASLFGQVGEQQFSLLPSQ